MAAVRRRDSLKRPFVLAATVLVGTTGVSSAPDSAPSENSSLRAFCERGWGFPAPKSLAELEARLGRLTRKESGVVPNPHVDGEELEWLVIRARGVEFRVVLIGRDPNRLLISEVSVEDPSRRLALGLRVGAPVGQFRRVLGPPDRERPDELEYDCNETESVTVSATEGVVRRVRWNLYVD